VSASFCKLETKRRNPLEGVAYRDESSEDIRSNGIQESGVLFSHVSTFLELVIKKKKPKKQTTTKTPHKI
jgi:hypothetical protein